MPDSSLSYAAAAVLHAIRCGRSYGFEIMEATGLPSGTVYPALRRMEKTGMIRAAWERESIARAEQRPARRYYRVTPAGDTELVLAAGRYRLPDFAAVDTPR
jgi:PadR family transcriptional regulator, regulatory protein PadR